MTNNNDNQDQQYQRLAIGQTLVYFAAFIGLGLTAASLGPTLPGLAEHTGSALAQASILFSSRSFGYMLGSLRGGRLYDRLPGNPLLAVLLVVMAIMMALVPIISLLWLLILVLFALGIAEGALDVGGNTMLLWLHQRRVGPFMNALHFFFGVGAFLAPIVIAQAYLRTGDINWAYWLLALYLIPVGLVISRLPSPKMPAAAREAVETGIAYPMLAALITAFFFLYVGAEASFGDWIFSYAIGQGLADEASAAYLTSIFWGVFTIGRLVGIPLATRVRPQTILVGELAGCVLFMGAILLFPESLLALQIGAAGLGFSMASMFPSMLVYAGQRMPLNGRITGWFFVGVGAGAMFLPWLIGQLFEKIGPISVMWVIMIDLLVIWLVFIGIKSYNRKTSNVKIDSVSA